jgi:MerR family copper efflux transcriptional regulator
MERPLTVGQLARATGVPSKTIRYYEQVGVLPAPRRSGAGYRQYSRHDIHRLLFMRRARALGLSLANLKALMAELDSGECLTMRPRLHALVLEQLRTVQRHIAEFQLLERQLAQVLHRLRTAAPGHHADGCRCLDSDIPEAQESLQPLSSIPRKGEAMHTSTLEPFTLLAPSPLSETNSAAGEQCGCGCGCGMSLTQLTLPQDTVTRRGDQNTQHPYSREAYEQV